MKIEIDNYFELLALHKTIMAVKFDANSCLPEAQGSPFTASLAVKVFNALIHYFESENKIKERDNWLNWQVADENRSETKLLKERIKNLSWWENSNLDQRKTYINEFMAPLKLPEELQNAYANGS